MRRKTDQARVVILDDVQAARRGLDLKSKTDAELTQLRITHTHMRLNLEKVGRVTRPCAAYQPFASRVIVEACLQERVTRMSKTAMARREAEA